MAMAGLIEGERPPRPAHPSFTPELWELMQRCWDQNPYLRPEISEVLGVLTGLSVRRSLSGNVVYRPEHFIMYRDSPSSSNPLQRLHCLEKFSPQFPDQLTSLLSGGGNTKITPQASEGRIWCGLSIFWTTYVLIPPSLTPYLCVV